MKSLNLSLPDSSIIFYPEFLSQKLSNQLYHSLLEEVDWTQNDITIFGKTYKVPGSKLGTVTKIKATHTLE